MLSHTQFIWKAAPGRTRREVEHESRRRLNVGCIVGKVTTLGNREGWGEGVFQSKGKEAFLIFRLDVFDSGSLQHESGGTSHLASEVMERLYEPETASADSSSWLQSAGMGRGRTRWGEMSLRSTLATVFIRVLWECPPLKLMTHDFDKRV